MGNSQRSIPNGWRLVRLGDVIAEAKPGFASGARDPKGVVQLRMNNVDTRGRMVWAEFIRIPAQNSIVSEYQLVPGDVLFNNTNSAELVGKSAVFLGFREPVVYSNHFTRLKASPQQLDPQYLAGWLLQQWQLKVFENTCNRWVGQSAVKNDKLLALQIPLPPLEEQKRIAAILNEQMAAVGRARAAADAQLEAAKTLPAAHLRAVFSSPEAQQWPRKGLGELAARISKGESPAWQGYEYTLDGPRFIRSENVLWGSFSDEPRIFIPQGFHSKLTRSKLKAGDVLINLVGASIGRACVLPPLSAEANVNQAVAVVTPKDSLDAFFLVAFCISPEIQAHFHDVQVEMARPNISLQDLRDLRVPVPPFEKQKWLSAGLQETMALAESARKAIEEELDTIDKLPAALLRGAFEGRL